MPITNRLDVLQAKNVLEVQRFEVDVNSALVNTYAKKVILNLER